MFVRGRRPEFVVLERAVLVLSELELPVAGSVLIDVGANIGTTTVTALLRHGFDRALAFEPDPDNLRLLEANVALNALGGRVDVVPAAVSDRSGRASFGRGGTIDEVKDGAGSLLNGNHHSRQRLPVDVTTIDDELARRRLAPAHVGMLWIDVQGNEPEVLAGATELLAGRPPIVLAFRPKRLARSSASFAELERFGYASFVNLRASHLYAPRPWQPDVQPLSSIDAYHSQVKGTTDLLLLPRRRSDVGPRPPRTAVSAPDAERQDAEPGRRPE